MNIKIKGIYLGDNQVVKDGGDDSNCDKRAEEGGGFGEVDNLQDQNE